MVAVVPVNVGCDTVPSGVPLTVIVAAVPVNSGADTFVIDGAVPPVMVRVVPLTEKVGIVPALRVTVGADTEPVGV